MPSPPAAGTVDLAPPEERAAEVRAPEARASEVRAPEVRAPEDPFEPHGVDVMVHRVAEAAVEKAGRPISLLVRATVGGAMVSFGVLLSLVVSTGVTNQGLSSLVMGLAFGMSLVLILVSGMSLVTAEMAAGALAVLRRRMSVLIYLRLLAIGLLGNVAGALAFVLVCAAAGGPYLGAFAERAAAVGAAKAGQPFPTALLLAMLCTWFLQTAMCLFFKARSDVARMGFAFYGPFAFVVGGTQHVIANVGFLGLPLMLSTFHHVPDGGLTWGFGANGLLANLAVTTIGNLIGGTLLVALPFQLVVWLQQRGR